MDNEPTFDGVSRKQLWRLLKTAFAILLTLAAITILMEAVAGVEVTMTFVFITSVIGMVGVILGGLTYVVRIVPKIAQRIPMSVCMALIIISVSVMVGAVGGLSISQLH